jgi:REP element-mobilizing transposase RayT
LHGSTDAYFDGSPLQKARPTGPCKGSVGAIIAQFKSQVTKKIWKNCRPDQQPIWQRNYYDHIIRNQDELQKITDYIQMNAVNWEVDEE